MLTIHGMIERHASINANHIAILDSSLTYTYDDLNKKANQLAHYLQQYKLPHESMIAIALDRSAEFLISILAILKSGCAYLPLDAKYPRERLMFQLNDAEAPVIITHSSYKENFSGYTGRIILLDQIGDTLGAQPTANLSLDIPSSHLAYVIYTSGSTGQPKGVLVEHGNVVNYIHWFKQYSGCSEQERIDFSSSIVFDMAVTSSLAALALGLQISICSDEIKKNIREYLRYLQNNHINAIKITPGYFKILRETAANLDMTLPDLRAIILGGEQLHTRDCENWLKLYPHHTLYNEYGPTEITVAATQFKVTNKNISVLGATVPIGKPGLNMACTIDETTGELFISGKGVARGYLKQEKLTKERFANQAYKTGDVCHYLPDGNIEFIRRIDNQVKIRGYRVEPGEVEVCLKKHTAIKDAVVVARTNASGEQELLAFYILKKNDEAAIALHPYLQKQLADYMIPAFFVKIDSMPLTDNDKLDTHSLPFPEKNSVIVAAQHPIEQDMLKLWKNIFCREDIGITCSFFDLGGHSLLAARLINAIEQQFQIKLSLQQLYDAPTIKELSLLIKQPKNRKRIRLRKQKKRSRRAYNNKNIPLGDFQFFLWALPFVEPKLKKLNIIIRNRVAGEVDKNALEAALNWVIRKHEALSYQPKVFFPLQYFKQAIDLEITETNLKDSSEEEAEKAITESINTLTYRKTWSFGKNPWITVKLFTLKNNITEIQLAIPHIIFDYSSKDIFLTELNHAYLHYKNGQPLSLTTVPSFKEFIYEEKEKANQSLSRDIHFWKNYLEDTCLITLPEAEIVRNMKNKSYSTYLKIPENTMQNIQHISSSLSLSMTNLLCAAVTLSLKKTNSDHKGKVLSNIVRTVRDSEQYMNTIGCFLRLDPAKLDLDTPLDLIALAEQIQKSRLETESWQTCPTLVKLACLNKNMDRKNIAKKAIDKLCEMYCSLLPDSKLNASIFKMAAHLASVRSKNQFPVNINLYNVATPNTENSLFGLSLIEAKLHQYDLLSLNNVLEISFLSNENPDQVYLVVSANLTESYRKKIGEEIIDALAAAT